MFQSLKKILKHKYFLVFAVLILIMLPSTLYMQSDKDETLIVTTIGIDQENDKYKVTALSVIPKGSNDINSNLEVFSATGDTLAEALDTIALDNGKKIGFAHCDCIIVSNDIMQNNITKVMDFFIRTSNLTTNATIVGSENASQLIEATKSSNNLLDLSLKNIVTYQENNSFLDDITIESFYRTHYTKSSTFYLPVISASESDSSEGGSGGGDNESSGNSGSESSGSGGTTSKQMKIKNDSTIAVLQNGKFTRNLSDDEKFIYNLISPSSKHLRIVVEDINDQYVNDSKEVFQQVDKFVLPIYKFVDDKPVVEYKIWLSIMIDEIVSTENFSYASIDSLQNFMSDIVEEKIKTQIEDKLQSTVDAMHSNKDDILHLYEKFNAFHPIKWQNYMSSLDNSQDYLEGVELKIDVSLNYVI